MQETSEAVVETGNEERIFDQLQRSLNLLEADYRRTLEAGNRPPEATNETQVTNGPGGNADQDEEDEDDDDDENATIPEGYSALGGGSDDEGGGEDSEQESDEQKSGEDEAHPAAAPLSENQVREIQSALSGLQLPEPEWAKGLTDEKLMGEVRSVLAVHAAGRRTAD